MRMPFLIRYPRLIRPGSVNKDLCINVDIGPTLLELAGVDVPDAMQGRSMVSLLKGQEVPDWRKSQFYTYWGIPAHYGIRTKRFTYLKIAGHPAELFDREEDPEQLYNVAGRTSYRDAIVDLEGELKRQAREVGIEDTELPGATTR